MTKTWPIHSQRKLSKNYSSPLWQTALQRAQKQKEQPPRMLSAHQAPACQQSLQHSAVPKPASHNVSAGLLTPLQFFSLWQISWHFQQTNYNWEADVEFFTTQFLNNTVWMSRGKHCSVKTAINLKSTCAFRDCSINTWKCIFSTMILYYSLYLHVITTCVDWIWSLIDYSQ